MNKPAVMVGLGEVLWDLLPSGRVLGGAPANFAYMANALGDQGIVASRVGVDHLGKEASETLEKRGLTAKYLQLDDQHETGTAEVLIDPAGQPTFTIRESVSWDFLQWTLSWEELSATADVICFGSLAQRSHDSAATIDSFLRNARPDALRIFDVNLRQSFYSAEVLRRSLGHANIVKLTDEELQCVTTLLMPNKGDLEQLARRLLYMWNLRLVCVTRGARGSLIVSESETVEHDGFPVKVADTVGAGDAFTASLAHYLIRGHPLREICEASNQFASWVTTQTGATPTIDQLQLRMVLSGNCKTGAVSDQSASD